MPSVVQSPIGGAGQQFFDNNGNVLSGGLLYTYAAGTTTPQTTYTTSAGTVARTNPVVLDSAGRVSGDGVWLLLGYAYKFVLKNSTGATTYGTWDNISGGSSGITVAATVAALALVTGMNDGARILVTDWGFYRYSAASTATVNGANVVTAAGGTGRWLLEVEGAYFEPVYNVKDYGATGDGVTNDYAACQATIAAAEAAGTSATVYFPRGTYLLGTGLVQNTTGKEIVFKGDGMRASVLKASAAINILTLSQATGNHIGKTVMDLGFYGTDLATAGIEAPNLRYSLINRCRFERMAPAGCGLNIASWVNRVELCRFLGAGSGGTAASNGIVLTSGITINNMVVRANDFNTCLVGLTSNGHNDLTVIENTFDACSGAGIWMKVGARRSSIQNNYFEACGSTGVSVEIAASTFQTFYGAIVANTLYSSLATVHRGLTIQRNLFANCSSTAYITLSSVVEMDISDNDTHDGYTGTTFVKLEWEGIPYTSARRCVVDHCNSVGSQFTYTVEISPDTPRDQTCGLIVKDRNSLPQNVTTPAVNLFGNPLSWSLASGSFTTFQRDGSFDGDPVWKIDGTGVLSKEVTTEDVLPALRGRYFRPEFISRGDTGNANGLRLRVYYDVGAGYVEQYAATAPSGADWVANRMPTFYIPTTCTALKITAQPLFNTIPCWFTHFNICLADVDYIVAPPQTDLWLDASVAWDPGNILDGDMEAKDITVSGAMLGDFVLVSFSLDVTDLTLTGTVTAANTVTAVLANNTGGAVNLGNGTLRARVMKL